MKTFVVILSLCLITSLAFAGIEQAQVETKIASEITACRDNVESYAGYLINVRDRVQVIATSSHLSSEDKAKLPDLKTKVNSAIDSLSEVKTYIEEQWQDLD